jgi:hypothetical protein
MKQPIESDFDVRNHDAGVDVTFKPTYSQYSGPWQPISAS